MSVFWLLQFFSLILLGGKSETVSSWWTTQIPDSSFPRAFILGWCMQCSGSFPVELIHGWILICGKWLFDVSDSHPSGQKGIPSIEGLQATQALSFCK